jgi:hypothetical protein
MNQPHHPMLNPQLITIGALKQAQVAIEQAMVALSQPASAQYIPTPNVCPGGLSDRPVNAAHLVELHKARVADLRKYGKDIPCVNALLDVLDANNGHLTQTVVNEVREFLMLVSWLVAAGNATADRTACSIAVSLGTQLYCHYNGKTVSFGDYITEDVPEGQDVPLVTFIHNDLTSPHAAELLDRVRTRLQVLKQNSQS